MCHLLILVLRCTSLWTINRSPHISPCVRKWRQRVARGLHFKKDSAYTLHWGQKRAQAPLKQDTLWGSRGTRRRTPSFHTCLNEGEYHCLSTWQRLQQRKCSSRLRSQQKYDFFWREQVHFHKCCPPSEPLITATAELQHGKGSL